MATLYVENVPDDLYDALRSRAKENRRSIAAEVLLMLEENLPTDQEMGKRRQFLNYVRRVQAGKRATRKFPSTEEMIRQDRER